jgi:plasmid stability protein
MAQFVVRQLEDDVKARLQRRAKRHGRSMEEEVRQILRSAALDADPPVRKVGTRIAERFKKAGLTTDLPELRGASARPADFDR